MRRETVWLLGLLGAPLAVAALLASVALLISVSSPASAQGAGVDGKDGFTVTTVADGTGGEYLVVSSYDKYMGDDQQRQFLTFYEVNRTGQGQAELALVGSRCIDFDRGFELLNFNAGKGLRPSELEKELNKSRRPKPSSNEPASNK